jgi:hypothetical protein
MELRHRRYVRWGEGDIHPAPSYRFIVKSICLRSGLWRKSVRLLHGPPGDGCT